MISKRKRLIERKRYYETLAAMLKWIQEKTDTTWSDSTSYNGYVVIRKVRAIVKEIGYYDYNIYGVPKTSKGFKTKRYKHLWRVLEYIDNIGIH